MEFDIGRKLVHNLLGIPDHAISNHHLQITCNIYDEDDTTVIPTVYVKVLSRSCNAVLTKPTGIRALLKHDRPAHLLDDGDEIRLSRRVSVLYRAYVLNGDLDQASECHLLQSSTDRYSVTKHTIGKGANGNVVLAIRHSDRRQFICKTVSVDGDGKSAEATILAMLSHPNLVTTHALFLEQPRLHIMQELATGGDLYSYLRQRHGLSEGEVVMLAYQLTQAVCYLHNSGIVHRDIKPENILLASQGNNVRIVLTDFGQARTVDRSSLLRSTNKIMRMSTRVGTIGWIAPELRLSELAYGPAIDMWGLGSVILSAFTQQMPQLESQVSLPESHQMVFELTAAHACGASEPAITFLRACLTVNDDLRLTAADAMVHPWFHDKLYATDLQAAYKKAISLWRPAERPRVQDVEVNMQIQATEQSRPNLTLESVIERQISDHSFVTQMLSSSQHYVTQATLPMRDDRSLEPSMDAFIPPPSTQMAGVSFSQVPDHLLQSYDRTSASDQ